MKVTKAVSSSENVNAGDEAASALVLPLVGRQVLAQRDHPGLLLDVNVKVVTLDVGVSLMGLATIWMGWNYKFGNIILADETQIRVVDHKMHSLVFVIVLQQLNFILASI